MSLAANGRATSLFIIHPTVIQLTDAISLILNVTKKLTSQPGKRLSGQLKAKVFATMPKRFRRRLPMRMRIKTLAILLSFSIKMLAGTRKRLRLKPTASSAKTLMMSRHLDCRPRTVDDTMLTWRSMPAILLKRIGLPDEID